LWNREACSGARSFVHNAQDFIKQFSGNFNIDNERTAKMKEFLSSLDNGNVDVQPVLLTVEDIENGVRSLRCSKSLDCNNLCINHILFSHPVVYSCIALLFNVMIKHGYVPSNMGLSVIHQIVKNNKSVHDISNYRPISILPILTKVFESYVGAIIESKLL
jgi:hypothetical protein